LKTGASYLPMDTQYPDERLQYFIGNARPKLVLTLPHLFSRLGHHGDTTLCSIHDEAASQLAKTNLDIPVSPEQLVYVLYTSGSTGLPNCTASFHHNEHNLLSWYCRRFNMKGDDRVLVISALGFDLTQKNLMAPLV